MKGNTKEHLLLFYGDREISGIHAGKKIKIKFEVDTNPSDFAGFETKYGLLPSPYEVRLYDPPSLFAGKLHAVLCRTWRSRIKGRDLYDYVFYLSKSIPVNMDHLKARLVQTGYINEGASFTLADLKQRLADHFEAINYEQAKQDVVPFIRNLDTLSVWNINFFQADYGRFG